MVTVFPSTSYTYFQVSLARIQYLLNLARRAGCYETLECAVSKLAGTRSSSRCSARGELAANVLTNCDFAHAEQII